MDGHGIPWDRSQWAGEPRDETESAHVEQWSLYQWAGDLVADERPIVVTPPVDTAPHGFDGFGASDSGGQRWAPSIGGVEEPWAADAELDAEQDEDVA